MVMEINCNELVRSEAVSVGDIEQSRETKVSKYLTIKE